MAWRRGTVGRVEITVTAEVFALHVNYRRHRCIHQVSYICNALLRAKQSRDLDTPADNLAGFQPFYSSSVDQAVRLIYQGNFNRDTLRLILFQQPGCDQFNKRENTTRKEKQGNANLDHLDDGFYFLIT